MSDDKPGAEGAQGAVFFGPFRLDREQKLLFRDGDVVPLTPKAYEMFDLLVRNAGRVVDKESLLRGVWPDTFVDEANLSHHVFALRKALGDDREGAKYIETLPRRGYRFRAPLILQHGEPSPDGTTPLSQDGTEGATVRRDPLPVAEAAPAEAAPVVPGRRWIAWIGGGMALLAVGLLAGRAIATRPPEVRALRFTIAAPPGMTLPQTPTTNDLAISPDGRVLAFIAMEGHRRRLFVRALEQPTAVPVEGAEDSAAPFWSPDGKWIGFFTPGFMNKVPAAGGPVQTICPARGGMAAWNREGQILFFQWGESSNETAQIVSDKGGAVRDIPLPGSSAWWPSFLPDGKHFIYYSLVPGERRGLYISSLAGGGAHRVSNARSRGEVRGNQLYSVRDSVLVRQKLNLETFAAEGDPVVVASPVFCFSPTGSANFSVSSDGSVIVFQRRALATQLVWRDWSGRELGRVGGPELYRRFAISPDGKRLAVDLADEKSQVSSVSVLDLGRAVRTRFLRDANFAAAPQWTHRGDALLLCVGDSTRPSNAPAISLLRLSDGSVRRIRPPGGIKFPTSITADDSHFLYTTDHETSSYINLSSISDPTEVSVWEGSDAYDSSDAVLSPDDRWVSYQSSESGRPEIYVRPFHSAGEKVRVSSAGGSEPQWTADGKALLFLSGSMLTRVELTGGDRPAVSGETSLFPISSAGMMEQAVGQSHYAATADRVLVREIPGGEDRDPVHVIAIVRN